MNALIRSRSRIKAVLIWVYMYTCTYMCKYIAQCHVNIQVQCVVYAIVARP